MPSPKPGGSPAADADHLSARRVLWITERYPPQKGGMAVSCDRLVSGLRRRDLFIDLIALTADAGGKRILQKERDGGADFFVQREIAPGNSAQMAWRLARQRSATGRYDFVVGFGANLAGHLATTYAAWLGVPSLVLVRGNDFDRDWFDPRRGFWTREALARADVIGAVAPDTVDRVKALFPDRNVCWTPNSVDPAAWELLPADRESRDEVRAELGGEGRRVVGVFGEVKYKKRLPLWLGALRDAGLKDQVGLLVVGRLDDEAEQILADPALVPAKIRHMSFCRRELLPGLYAACDYVALPSLFEGMPNVLLEAMAAGVVPIASDAGAMGEVIEPGVSGFLFPAEDRAAAADATSKALGLGDDELAAMSEHARDRVTQTFSPERELDVLSEILSGPQLAPDKN